MPRFEEIGADEESPSLVSEEDMEKAVVKAEKEVERIRKIRIQVREETPKAKILEALSETDEEFVAAIDALNEAQRTLGRFRGAQEGQHVAVGTASDKEKVGS